MPLTAKDGSVSPIDISLFRSEMKAATPATDHQYLEVTFGAANTDFDIRHDLKPSNPENIHYIVVRADRATSLYHDQSGTRRAWKAGYIVLRSSVANAKVTLLLQTPRT